MDESVLLTDEDRALLIKVSGLLEEIVETFSVMEDKEAVKRLKQAEADIKAGRVRDYDEFVKELKEAEKYKLQVTARATSNFVQILIWRNRHQV